MKYFKYKLAAALATFTKLSKFRKRAFWLLSIALLWTACKKEEQPPPLSEDPVFMVEFDLDTITGQSQLLTAGLDGVYLFTRFMADGQEITCAGSFAKSDCPDGDCPRSLTFEFRSELTDVFEPDSVFHLGGFRFVGSDSTSGPITYRTSFYADSTLGYDSFSWKINGEDVGTGLSIIVDFQDNTPKSLELDAKKTTGLQSLVQRPVSLTNPGGNSFPAVGLNVQQDSSAPFQITAETSGAPYNLLIWNTADTGSTIYTDLLDSIYSVTIFSDSASSSSSLSGLSPNDLPVRTANFTHTVEEILSPAMPGEVAIQWVDDAGVVWRSDRDAQFSSSFFHVLESEPYLRNENNQETYKMRVEFACILFNPDGLGRSFSGAGVIAVARP